MRIELWHRMLFTGMHGSHRHGINKNEISVLRDKSRNVYSEYIWDELYLP